MKTIIAFIIITLACILSLGMIRYKKRSREIDIEKDQKFI